MTKAEMTKLFAAMSLVYRHDKMFSAGIEALKPTIEIWTATLPELSYALGQQALIRVFRTCKYPPTPAELGEAADEILSEFRRQCTQLKNDIQFHTEFFGSVEEYYASLPNGHMTRCVIDRIGGPGRLYENLEKGGQIWNWIAFEAAHKEICLSGGPALPGANPQALPPRKG